MAGSRMLFRGMAASAVPPSERKPAKVQGFSQASTAGVTLSHHPSPPASVRLRAGKPVLALNDLVTKVQSYHPAADVELIERAYKFAEWSHREQMRKSGDPYFIHPASVAGIIAELRLDTASVCAGLLHDVVE